MNSKFAVTATKQHEAPVVCAGYGDGDDDNLRDDASSVRPAPNEDLESQTSSTDTFVDSQEEDNEKCAVNKNKEIVLDCHDSLQSMRPIVRSRSLGHISAADEMPYMCSFRMPYYNDDTAAAAAHKSSCSEAASTAGNKSDYNFVLDNYIEYTDETKIPRLRGKDSNRNKLLTAIQSSHWAALCAVAACSCILTYSISNRQPNLRPDLAQGIVIAMVLATFPEVAASAGAGAFAGMASGITIPNYGWLALLALVTSVVWTTFHHFKILVGCGGRLGTSAFLSMNLTVALFIMPSGAVSWSQYGNINELWSERLELVPSILSVGACTFLSAAGGAVRLKSKLPLNPVQAPTSIALLCMLILEPTQFKYTTQIDAGLAVGSYVAMASEQYLSSVFDFGAAGFLSGLWILFLDPFFLGFGGKRGFTSFCGFVTYVLISKALEFIREKCRVKNEW